MEPNRKRWNDDQKKLRHALEKSFDRDRALGLFLDQHAMVHAGEMSGSGLHSFQDELLAGLPDDEYRIIPDIHHHSIAWIIWHLARIEDVTMNLLVAEKPQILDSGNWQERLKVNLHHCGNGMSDADIIKFSRKVDIQSILKYRVAVGRNTRTVVENIDTDELNAKVDPDRVERIWREKAMLPRARGIVEYWAGRTIAGLLLMPPTRHCFIHLNEIRHIRGM